MFPKQKSFDGTKKQIPRIRTIISLIIFIVFLPSVDLSTVSDVLHPPESLNDFGPIRVSYHPDTIGSVDCSPEGQYVAIGSFWDKSVTLWDKNSGSNQALEDELYEGVDVKFSSDGKHLLVVSRDLKYPTKYWDSHLTLYDVESKTIIRNCSMNDVEIWDAEFSPDGSAYTGFFEMDMDSEISTINILETKTGDVVNSITSNNYGVGSIAFSPDGQNLAVSFYNNLNPNRLVIFDLKTGDISRIINEKTVIDLQYSRNGSMLVGGSGYLKEVIAWDVASGDEIHRFKGLEYSPLSVSLSSDDKYIMATDGIRIIIWDIASKKKILNSRTYNLDFVEDFSAVTFSNEGREIIIGFDRSSDDGVIFVYDFEEIVESYYT